MSKKKNKKRSRERDERSRRLAETQRSVAVTVAWMMATVASAAALILMVTAYVAIRWLTPDNAAPQTLAAIPGLLLFVAVVTGSLSLILIPIVYQLRPSPPPTAVTVGSAGIGVAAWVAVLVQSWK
jgi:hypothetical protein